MMRATGLERSKSGQQQACAGAGRRLNTKRVRLSWNVRVEAETGGWKLET